MITTRKQFEEKNTRRHDLIHKKFDQGLCDEETNELRDLQKEVGEYIHRLCPLDPHGKILAINEWLKYQKRRLK